MPEELRRPGCCLYTDKGSGWFVLADYEEARRWVRGTGLLEFETISFEGLVWRVTVHKADVCQVDEMSEPRWIADQAAFMARREREGALARQAAAAERLADTHERVAHA